MKTYADPVAAAEIQRLRAKLLRVETLFTEGPDTVCRTTWRCEHPHWLDICEHKATKFVEVPMRDLLAALAEPEETV